MAKLERLHAAAGQLAKEAPEIIANPEAARGLESALIEAMAACLTTNNISGNQASHRHHEIIMRRFRRFIEDHPEEPLYIPEVCAAIGVPDRTLRLCCQQHLGMSPKRYLLLRRMTLVRCALRAAGPTSVTVTEIAAQYGFWQFGRFAGEYKALFGELPSYTLRAPGG